MFKMKRRSLLNRLFLTFCFYCFFQLPLSAANVDYAVTTPWLCEITNFIVGGRSQVRCLSVWDNNGELSIVRSPKAEEEVIVLNSKEVSQFKLSNNKRLHVLYKTLSVSEHKTRSLYYDPAIVPLIAQNVMKIVANKDRENYAYYQRRLAELQARIESTNDVGRHLLKDKKILDLTASQGVWIRSVSKETVIPPKEIWDKWSIGDTKSLRAALAESKRRGLVVILDPWTTNTIKLLASEQDNTVLLPAPTIEDSYFTHLNNIYMYIWNKTKEASRPQKN